VLGLLPGCLIVYGVEGIVVAPWLWTLTWYGYGAIWPIDDWLTGLLTIPQALVILPLAGAGGGVGYLLKDRVSDVGQFVDAVRRVADGGTALDPDVVSQLLARHARAEPLQALTPREHEVLGLMAEGRSNAAIASKLFITEKAISKHTNNLFAKLGLPPSEDDNRRVLAVLAYLNA
jgi:DNA-binding CsgD family transcriptional regulator